MAGGQRKGGALPKMSHSRDRDTKRQQADWTPMDLTPTGDLHGPELPETANGDPWHEQTRAMWDEFRRSPLMADEPALGWAFLLDTMLMHHTMWTKGRWEYAAELRLRFAKFGVTPEDRLRLKIKVKTPGDPEPAPAPSAPGDVVSRRRTMRIAT